MIEISRSYNQCIRLEMPSTASGLEQENALTGHKHFNSDFGNTDDGGAVLA